MFTINRQLKRIKKQPANESSMTAERRDLKMERTWCRKEHDPEKRHQWDTGQYKQTSATSERRHLYTNNHHISFNLPLRKDSQSLPYDTQTFASWKCLVWARPTWFPKTTHRTIRYVHSRTKTNKARDRATIDATVQQRTKIVFIEYFYMFAAVLNINRRLFVCY